MGRNEIGSAVLLYTKRNALSYVMLLPKRPGYRCTVAVYAVRVQWVVNPDY